MAWVGMAPMCVRRSRSITSSTAAGSKVSWISDAPRVADLHGDARHAADVRERQSGGEVQRRVPPAGMAAGLDLGERQQAPMRVPRALRRTRRAAGEDDRHRRVRRDLDVRRRVRAGGEALDARDGPAA